MQNIQLPACRLLVDEGSVQSAVNRLTDEINACYGDVDLLFLTVMNGGQIFAAELALGLKMNLEMDYLQVSRYGMETSGGQLRWKAKPASHIAGRDVLLVDDIYDEGHTLQALVDYCKEAGCKTVRSVVLVEKNHPREKANVHPEFIGFEVPDEYIFGYGMDYEGRWRHLPAIYALEASE